MLTRDLRPVTGYVVIWDGRNAGEAATTPPLPDYSGLPHDPPEKRTRGPRRHPGRPRSRLVHQKQLMALMADGQIRTKRDIAMALDWTHGRTNQIIHALMGQLVRVPGKPAPAFARYRIAS